MTDTDRLIVFLRGNPDAGLGQVRDGLDLPDLAEAWTVIHRGERAGVVRCVKTDEGSWIFPLTHPTCEVGSTPGTVGLINTPTTIRTAEIAHDERFYDLMVEVRNASDNVSRRIGSLHEYAGANVDSGYRYVYVGRQRRLVTPDYITPTVEESTRWVQAVVDGDWTPRRGCNSWGRQAPKILTNLAEAREALSHAQEALRAHEVDYTGWSRFFLVVSSPGHVHSSTHCSSCRITTAFAPVVSLSAAGQAEAVDLLGSALCTVCFPDAPVDGKVKKITAAQARKIAASAREAAA